MTEPKHSPLPWHVSAGQLVINQGGKWTSDQDDILYVNEEVGDADGFANRAIAEANAEFVCRACNAHDDLLDACQQAYDVIVGGCYHHSPVVEVLATAIAKATGKDGET